MDYRENLQDLRRQRNRAAVFAAVVVLAGIAVALPRNLAQRRQLKDAHQELIDTQYKIVLMQGQIRDLQAQIGRVETEITVLKREAR